MGEAPTAPANRKPKDTWPKEVKEGSVTVKVYEIERKNGRKAPVATVVPRWTLRCNERLASSARLRR